MPWLVHIGARSSLALLSSIGLATALPLGAQQPRQWTVARMDAEYADPFTCVRWGSIRELADGRLMVADPTEKRLEIIDFRTGGALPLGRQGAGPGEWGLPLSLTPLGPDTTLLFDPQNNRLLKIAADGGIANATIPLPAGRGGFGLGGPRGHDARGRLYSQGSSVTLAPGQPLVTADSAPILRFDPRTTTVDTVAHVRVPRPEVRSSGSGGQSRMMISMSPNPFLPVAAWAVAPDGRLAMITPEPYRVEWIGANGARGTGPVIPHQRLRVTDADKEATGSGGPQCSFTVTRNTSDGAQASFTRTTTAVGGPGGGNAPPPRNDWPEYKPPFLGASTSAAVAAQTGEVWVLRARAANDEVPVYDVFDAQGRLIARATLPRGSNLLGFGRGVVYLSRIDEDDLVYIQRWRLDTP